MQRRVSGKLMAVRAVIWCLFSFVWIYLSGMRIRALLALGRTVDWKNWAILAFWIAVLVFWAVMGIRSFLASRQRRTQYSTYEGQSER
jgi:hypothetical protein